MATLTTERRIFVFSGEDDYTQAQEADRWKRAFVQKHGAGTVESIRPSGAEERERLHELFASIRTPSLFAKKKLVVFHDAYLLTEEEMKHVAQILLQAPEWLYVLFVAATELSPASPLLSALSEFLSPKDFSHRYFALPRGKEFVRWILTEAKKWGLELGEEQGELIAELLGKDQGERVRAGKAWVTREVYNLHQAAREIEKLAVFANHTRISQEDILQLVATSDHVDAFAASEALLKDDVPTSLSHIEKELAGSQDREGALRLVGVLTEACRAQLLLGLLTEQGLKDAEIAKRLGWTPGRVFMQKRHRSTLSTEDLLDMLARLLHMSERFIREQTDSLLDFAFAISSAR